MFTSGKGGACRPGATLTVVAGDVQLPEAGVALLLSDDVLPWDADTDAQVNAARRAAGRARARGGCRGRAQRPERLAAPPREIWWGRSARTSHRSAAPLARVPAPQTRYSPSASTSASSSRP